MGSTDLLQSCMDSVPLGSSYCPDLGVEMELLKGILRLDYYNLKIQT